MKKFLKSPYFIIAIGLIFMVVIVIVNIFTGFVPHTVRTKDVTKSTEYTEYLAETTAVNVQNEGDSESYTVTEKADNRNEPYNNSGKININTASLEELSNLKLVGELRGKAIIQYRKKHGKFKTIEEIKNVYGIGEYIYKINRNNITVE